MGGRGGASLSGQMGHRHRHGSTASSDSEDTALVGGDSTGGSARHHHGGGGFLMNLLGLDRFTKGKAVDGLARSSSATNPFDLGVIGNCKDFWTAGRELGVEYEKLYDVPVEGFREAKRMRVRDDDDDDGSARLGKPSGVRKTLFMGMGFGLGRAGSSRGGYEPVNQV